MKKCSLCFGLAFIIFLTICPFALQAQIFNIDQFEQLNGKWLQISYQAKGIRFETPSSPPVKGGDSGKFYGCAYWDPTRDWTGIEGAPWVTVTLYYSDGDLVAGTGYLWFHSGTMEVWGARFDLELLGGRIQTVGTFTGKEDYSQKGQYSSFGGLGVGRNLLTSGKIKAKVMSDTTKLPFSPPQCGW